MPRLNEHDITLLDAARAFQAEYDGLRSSRVIAAYLKLRNRFSKQPYEPLELEAKWPPEKAWMRLRAKENTSNQHFFEHRTQHTNLLDASDGCAYYADAPRPRVGIITDEFMYDYYDGPLDLTYLYPDSYQDAIDNGALDFVLYVTCWHGRHDQVDTYYGNDPAGHERISTVLSYARAAGLPVAFQSIEDPPSYHAYLDLARQADYVFTSCEEKIPEYVRDLGHDRVFCCKFGVNPELNNPVGTGVRERLGNAHLRNSVLFAGSWYNEYPERCADTELIFDALIETGRNLIIFDRRWPVDWAGVFPEKYWHYVVPGINHKELQDVTKLFDFAVNMNSVKDSRTMCAMRTYELQAMGVLGIANDALALREQFPELSRVTRKEDVRTFFDNMDDTRMLRLQREGIRRIMSEHTVYDRLNLMFQQMGMSFRFPTQTVALVIDETDVTGSEHAERLAGAVPNARVVRASDCAADAQVSGAEPKPLFAVRISGNDGMTPETLQDAVNAFKYTNADFGRTCAPSAPERFSFCKEAPGADAVYNLRRWTLADVATNAAGSAAARGFVIPRG